MQLFLGLAVVLFSSWAVADCHFVSRDGKNWSSEKVFCFEHGANLKAKIEEKGKVFFEGTYLTEPLICSGSYPKCDQTNVIATPEKLLPAPAEWPTFPVLQWLPANYAFVLHYHQTANVVTGLMNVYDTNLAKIMVFCNVGPLSEAGKACRTDVTDPELN